MFDVLVEGGYRIEKEGIYLISGKGDFAILPEFNSNSFSLVFNDGRVIIHADEKVDEQVLHYFSHNEYLLANVKSIYVASFNFDLGVVSLAVLLGSTALDPVYIYLFIDNTVVRYSISAYKRYDLSANMIKSWEFVEYDVMRYFTEAKGYIQYLSWCTAFADTEVPESKIHISMRLQKALYYLPVRYITRMFFVNGKVLVCEICDTGYIFPGKTMYAWNSVTKECVCLGDFCHIFDDKDMYDNKVAHKAYVEILDNWCFAYPPNLPQTVMGYIENYRVHSIDGHLFAVCDLAKIVESARSYDEYSELLANTGWVSFANDTKKVIKSNPESWVDKHELELLDMFGYPEALI